VIEPNFKCPERKYDLSLLLKYGFIVPQRIGLGTSAAQWPCAIASNAFGGNQNAAMTVAAAARLLKAFATQVEALRRLRNGGSQFVRVEQVHINEGGQAIVGNVSSIQK